MKITFTPMRRDDRPVLSVTGDVLSIDGEAFDFSGIPEGATLPRAAVACDWLASDVTRADGEVALTLIVPHGPGAPNETCFPTAVTVAEGPVPLPPYEEIAG